MLELVALSLVVAAALPFALTTIVLAAKTPWWRTPAGRALMVSTPAVAVLLITELVFAFLPVSYFTETVVTIATLSLITVGGWGKFAALVYELRRGRRVVPPADH